MVDISPVNDQQGRVPDIGQWLIATSLRTCLSRILPAEHYINVCFERLLGIVDFGNIYYEYPDQDSRRLPLRIRPYRCRRLRLVCHGDAGSINDSRLEGQRQQSDLKTILKANHFHSNWARPSRTAANSSPRDS